jgi:hypothetical protein
MNGKFKIDGIVFRKKVLQGSFCNVHLVGHDEPITVQLGNDLTWPVVGEGITVWGLVVNGRRLSQGWHRAHGQFKQFAEDYWYAYSDGCRIEYVNKDGDVRVSIQYKTEEEAHDAYISDEIQWEN